MSTSPKVLENECSARFDELESSLFKAFLYFDIFNFPLTLEEIMRFSAFKDAGKAREVLNKWILQGVIEKEEKYFMLNPGSSKVADRKKAMFRADYMIARGLKRAALIYRFPFVRAVFFSGSISKGVVAEDGDVDFFIVTRPGRLWFTRTLLAVFKKVFLRNSHKYFCINYFIDSRHLEIEEKNLYTASEMVTIVPVCGVPGLIEDFYNTNSWVRDYYPNYAPREQILKTRPGRAKKAWEALFSIAGAVWVDRLCQNLTSGFWRRKFISLPEGDFEIALKSKRYVSKHHPQNFQRKVLTVFESKVAEFEKKHNLKLIDG